MDAALSGGGDGQCLLPPLRATARSAHAHILTDCEIDRRRCGPLPGPPTAQRPTVRLSQNVRATVNPPKPYVIKPRVYPMDLQAKWCEYQRDVGLEQIHSPVRDDELVPPGGQITVCVELPAIALPDPFLDLGRLGL